MPINHAKLARLKRQLSELDGAYAHARERVEFIRYGTASADGRRLQEPGVITPILRRLSAASPFNLPHSQITELRALVESTESHFEGTDTRRMRPAEAQMLDDCRLGRLLVQAYEELAEAEAHAADIAARRAPLSALVRRLDEYVGVDSGLSQSLGVRHVA